MSASGLRAALERAGFTPDFNVCSTCGHHGSKHDLGNWCLVCPRPATNVIREPFRARLDAGWCYFSSMDYDEQWAHGIALLSEAGVVAKATKEEQQAALEDALSRLALEA